MISAKAPARSDDRIGRITTVPSEGHGGCIIIIEVNEVSVGAPVPSSSLGVPLGAVSSEVSFLSAVETGTSGPGGSVLGLLGSVGVSNLHESSMCRVHLVESSLVTACSGTVEVHRDCQVVHVSWGIG